jgi:hypothetical protein
MKLMFSLFFFLIFVLMINSVFAIQPNGANVTKGESSTAPVSSAGSAPAQAGNVSELNVFGYSTTQTWQGYFGNVTGTIQLANSGNKVLYNWSQASPSGEVYASTNQTIYWTNIQCFNFSATGAYNNENGNGGTTSLYGTNLSQLESQFNINDSDVDGVNETFSFYGAGTHNTFFTASKQFTEGQCRSTRVYDNTGTGINDKFEEVLLYEPQSTSIIFTSLLNKDAMGFDDRTHDFEMLVLEDGHGSDTSTTPYYFYVELQ